MSDEIYCLADWPKYSTYGKSVPFHWVVSCAKEVAQERYKWGAPKGWFQGFFKTPAEQVAAIERSLLGEAAYAARCGRPWVIHERGDGGCDMMTPPGSVDVKTTWRDEPLRLNLKHAKKHAAAVHPQYYLLVWANDSETPAEVVRYAHKQLLLDAPIDYDIHAPAHTLQVNELLELNEAGFPELTAGEIRW